MNYNTTALIHEMSQALMNYRVTLDFFIPNYIIDYDDSIVAHATYLAKKAAGGFHDLRFNFHKSGYRYHHEFDLITDP